MENNNGVISKKTMGRRKIEIKKIEKKTSLQVTFTKRRMGLFRKASELSVLCGAEIAILVQSPADKIFSYGHPSVEALVDRFQNNGSGAFSSASTSSSLGRQIVPWAAADDGRSKYEEAVRKLENEKRSMMKQGINIDAMELHELEEYVEAMEALKNNVVCRLEEMSKLKLQADFASTSNYADRCNYHVLPLQTINDQEFHGGKSEFEVPKAEGNEDDHISAVLQMEKGSIGGSCSSTDFIANRTGDDDDGGGDDGAVINIYKDMLCFDENPNFSGCFI